jgi:hypothetical protein
VTEKTVSVQGKDITVRPLSLAQVRAVRKADEDHADVLAISWASGLSVDEAREIFESAPAGQTLALVAAIFEVSGLTEGAQFPQ